MHTASLKIMCALKKKKIFGNVAYTLKKLEGSELDNTNNRAVSTKVYVGPYIICDGGYHKWKILLEPLKHAVVYQQIRWSKWLESVRKDIERVFGIMKKRFLILKHGMEYSSQAKCDNVFLACSTLGSSCVKPNQS